MRTKARGLPRKIVINRRVADLGERASPHFYNACYVRRSWPSLSHPPLKAANCIYELSERSSSDWLLTRRPISANLPTYIGWGGGEGRGSVSHPRGGNYRDPRLFEVDDNGFTQSKTFLARNGLFHSGLTVFVAASLSFLTYFFSPRAIRFVFLMHLPEIRRNAEGGVESRSLSFQRRLDDLNAWKII